MFENEVLIDSKDKEIILSNIKIINDILGKYEYSNNYNLHTVTTMSKAKTVSKEAGEWIGLLKVKND